MDSGRAAVLRTLLVGVPLPATKPELFAYAERQRAEPDLLSALRSLPEREYASLAELADELLGTQPGHEERAPYEETSPPPGGEAYTRPPRETAWVRDLPPDLS
jgi:hypothetical protein